MIGCDECRTHIKKRVLNKIKFRIKDFRKDKKESRQEVLEFIIETLYRADGYNEAPQAGRKKITKLLLEHGQFKKNEIDEVFNQYSHESTDYTIEFIKNHSETDLMKFLREGGPVEIHYNFPFASCDYIRHIGFCKMKVEVLKCPDCGSEVLNAPLNVTIGYESDLLCPCSFKREDEFDTRGVIKRGNPKHHGYWDKQKPELVFTGTDYFAILHPKCKKSEREDGKGFMRVNGVWADDCGRVVLSLECEYCGARNALKPFSKGRGLPLLNESGAEWKRVESPIFEIIRKGESGKIEFKSSLRYNYKTKQADKDLEYDVIRTIAGFMNTEGGTLLIGVSDSKEIVGLKKDYSTLGRKKDYDRFELLLTDLINVHLGKELKKYVETALEVVSEKEICYVEIRKSPRPVFIKREGKKEFVIRSGNRTQTLDPEETLRYCETHWRPKTT